MARRFQGSLILIGPVSFAALVCFRIPTRPDRISGSILRGPEPGVGDALHSSGGVFTILYSVFSFGAVVSALVVAHRSLVRIRHIIFGAFALGLTTLVLALVPGVAVAVPAVFLVGMASILYLTATTAIVQVEAKPEMHGRVLALQTVILGGSALIGGPVLGWLADAVGGRAPLILGGAVSLIAATFGYYASRRYVPRTS